MSKTSTKENSDLKEMKTMIQSLSNTVEQLEKKVNSNIVSSQALTSYVGSSESFSTEKGNQSFPRTRGRGKNKRRGNYSGPQEPFHQPTDQNQQPNYQTPTPNFNRQAGYHTNRGSNSSYSQCQISILLVLVTKHKIKDKDLNMAWVKI